MLEVHAREVSGGKVGRRVGISAWALVREGVGECAQAYCVDRARTAIPQMLASAVVAPKRTSERMGLKVRASCLVRNYLSMGAQK